MEAKQRRAVRSGKLNPRSNVTMPALPPCTPLRYRVICGTPSGYEGSLTEGRAVTRETRRAAAWATSVETQRTPAPRKHTPSIRPSQKFIINAATARTTLEQQLAALQDRELTPEDYELLLRLDESVKPKTVAKAVLSAFKPHVVTAAAAGATCTVCQCELDAGDTALALPCGHTFHEPCITRWLAECADRCPVDGVTLSG